MDVTDRFSSTRMAPAIALLNLLWCSSQMEKHRTRQIGKAALGGLWELVDHTGVTRKSSDYYGHWLILYFRFTHCPDVCPDKLEKMSRVVDAIGGHSSQHKPLFYFSNLYGIQHFFLENVDFVYPTISRISSRIERVCSAVWMVETFSFTRK